MAEEIAGWEKLKALGLDSFPLQRCDEVRSLRRRQERPAPLPAESHCCFKAVDLKGASLQR
jgi:hypothetical protein